MTKLIQTPRFSITANVPLPQLARIDAVCVRLGLTRHGLLLRALALALPTMEMEARAITPPRGDVEGGQR